VVGELDQVGEAVRRDGGDVVAGHRRGLVGWGLVRGQRSALGPIGIRPIEIRTMSRWRSIVARAVRATAAAVLALTLPRTAVAEGEAEAAA
jgi:hypothetical protein